MGKLTLRALKFYDGKEERGGGLYVERGSNLDIVMCIFASCFSAGTCASDCGGGGQFTSMEVKQELPNVAIYNS